MSMTISRKQFEMAVNRVCKSTVEAYIRRNDPFAVFERDMDIQALMAFYDILTESNRRG